ncbi:MAG: PHP domain-containing protein [Thiotrichales bacterium]|nr:PHP domain-containing protein [Thiotrichales bacterium]
MKVDFHCHSTASDGSLSPEALLALAQQHQVEMLALTDHDTTAGYRSLIEPAKAAGIHLISGAEISCQWLGQTIHIVGLDFDDENPVLQQGLAHIREARKIRAQQILDKLSTKANTHLQQLPAHVERLVGDGVIGRGHIAQAMCQLGLVSHNAQAFDRYLKRGRPGYVAAQWPELAEVVQWITQAGGLAVVAHPGLYGLTSNKLNRLLEGFVAAGGQGLEVVNAPRANAEQVGMAQRAQRFGLYASLGSDFHHPQQSWRGLGWLAPLPKGCVPIWQAFKPAAVIPI